MREKFHIFVQLNYKYVESLPLLFSKYFWQGFIRQHLIWTWDKSLISPSKPKSIVRYLNWLYGTNIDESMNEIYQKHSTLRLIHRQLTTFFSFFKKTWQSITMRKVFTVLLDLLALLKRIYNVARRIGLIQNWSLFPVQVVKILNTVSTCYS